jgi:hypothetical protein
MSIPSYRQIDTSVRALDTDGVEMLLRSNDPKDHLAALVVTDASAGALLRTLRQTLPWPMRWKNALGLYFRALDALKANPEFKAGKDL